MGYQFTAVKPAAHLSAVIKSFFIIEFDQDTSRRDCLLPDGLPSFFYISAQEPVRTHFGKEGQTISLQEGFYAGYSNTVVTFTHAGMRVAGASVFPVYFSLLFGKHPSEIINRFTQLKAPASLMPVRSLLTEPVNSFAPIVGSFEAYVTDQLHRLDRNVPSHDFLQLCEKLTSSTDGHRQRVETMAAQLGCTTRYVHLLFQQVFGMSPKKFIKLVRFNHALKCIYEQQDTFNLSSIAYEAGYHDQSHFIRDFKTICGKTPKEVLNNPASLANKFCLF